MNLKDNLLSLYRRQGYTYAPVEMNLCPSQRETFRSLAGDGVTMGEYFDYPQGFQQQGVPGVTPAPRDVDWAAFYPDALKPGTTFDMWGIAHEPGSADAHHMTRMRHPMLFYDSLEQIQAYPWPDFESAPTDRIAVRADEIHAQGQAAMFGMACTIWETSWYLRGMPDLMMDMATDDPKATWLLDKVTDTACYRAAVAARADVDILHLGDDVGMQSRIMMSKGMYRAWLKPRLAKVIAAARAIKPDILIFYHSCGHVTPFIEDFIDIGIDILNPVQPESMDFAAIHAEYGERLSFNGTLGTQSTFPFGTPNDVREVVHANLTLAGDKGGLVVCPTHMVEPEVPWENIVAYVEAVKEFLGS